jgi:hypothetical protein
MSDLERTVAEVRAALAKATKGPWKAEGPSFGYFTVRQDPVDWNGQGYQQVCGMPSLTKHSAWRATFQANADLIAHAPSWLFALCDGVEAITAKNATMLIRWLADTDAAYARGLEAAKHECDFLRAGLASDAEYFGSDKEDSFAAEKRQEYLGKASIAKLCMDRIDGLRSDARRAPQAETEGR